MPERPETSLVELLLFFLPVRDGGRRVPCKIIGEGQCRAYHGMDSSTASFVDAVL